MTSRSRKLERKQALQARTRSAKSLLVIAFVCIGLGVLGAVVMAALSFLMQISTVSVLSGPIALLSLTAFAVLLRREALVPRKTGFLGRCAIVGLSVCGATMGTSQVLSWTGTDGASLAALLTLVPALLSLVFSGSWALRNVNAEGVSTSSIMNTITSSHS
jgi:hypothetical protein